MEINVWMQKFGALFAWCVTFLSKQSNETQRPKSLGSLPDAPASAAGATSTSKNTLTIIRKQASSDAMFGEIYWAGEKMGVTMERTAVAIPTGTFHCEMENSPHFGFATPHLSVDGRTYIEIHPANYPLQLEGCIAVGTAKDNDSLDNSRLAFDKLVAVLPRTFDVSLSSAIS